MYNDGYKYWLAYKKNNTSYYRCSRYKTNCPGRCVVEDEKVRNTTPHNHSPEPDRVLVDKFRKTLTYRAATETTDLYNIFWDEAIQRHADAAMLYSFAAAESAMRKARRKQLPPAPNTLQELGDVLSKSNLFRIHSGQNKDAFYEVTLTLTDTTCLIFVHRKTLELVGRIEEMHLDVSFDIKPVTQPSYFLLTAHCVQSYNSVPFLYTVMTSKTATGYAAIFAYMRENYPSQIIPNVIICNFDAEMQSTLALTFPEATIKGFWSHYTNAILKHTKQLELQRETARGHGASFLRMILVLPLLPAEYMTPGLEALRKWAQEKKIFSHQFMDLCQFVEQTCIRALGAEKLSIFGLPHCVHNHIQHFNKDLESSLGAPNPMIWQMLECLASVATRTYVKVSKRSKHLAAAKVPKKGQHVIDSIIKNATQLWIRTPVHLRNPLNFLQLSSHCINDTIYYSNLNDIRRKDNKTEQSMVVRNKGAAAVATTTTSQSVNILGTFTLPTSNYMTCMNGQQFKVIAQTPAARLDGKNTSKMDLKQTNKRIGNSFYQQSFDRKSQLIIDSNGVVKKLDIKSDPPPLAFFPKAVKPIGRKIMLSSEPPPLVPIGTKK